MRICIYIILTLLFSYLPLNAELIGIGYGKNNAEAKKEALADLTQSIKVQIFSKYDSTKLDDNGKVYTQSSKYTKLSSNVALLSPEVSYMRENGEVKAVATAGNPAEYSKKLEKLARAIDSTLGDKPSYKAMLAARKLYAEYENYKLVADILGVSEDTPPSITSADLDRLILSMQEAPPSLDVAASVIASSLIEGMRDINNIYVEAPVASGSDKPSEFSAFFKDLLDTKLPSVKVKEGGKNRVSCSYAESGANIIMACNLIAGASKVLSSSVVEIPTRLLPAMNIMPKIETEKLFNDYVANRKQNASDYKLQIKISSLADSEILREGEPFSLLVKVNKPGYLYFITFNNGQNGEANILSTGYNNDFIKHIDKSQVNKWVSIGQYRVKAPFGSETLQAFIVSDKLSVNLLLPEYARERIGYLKNVRPEALMKDMLALFDLLNCEKGIASTTFLTAPKRD